MRRWREDTKEGDRPMLELENVRIKQWGPDKFDHLPSINVKLTAYQAKVLSESGWNVKHMALPHWHPLGKGCYLRVSGQAMEYGALGTIKKLVIRGYEWEVQGRSGTKAHVHSVKGAKQEPKPEQGEE